MIDPRLTDAEIAQDQDASRDFLCPPTGTTLAGRGQKSANNSTDPERHARKAWRFGCCLIAAGLVVGVAGVLL